MRRTRTTLTLVLHSHLPWVLHHGRWPHGSEWLCEAAAESYQPLARCLEERSGRSRSLGITLGLTPVLCEQLTHPDFSSEFRDYLELRRAAAREDRARFAAEGREVETAQAGRWERFYARALEEHLGSADGSLVVRFRRLEERGAIEIVTSAASHAYLPLLGTPRAVERQIALARRVHRRHFGRDPRGMWLPECAYRPGGPWISPVEPGRVEPWRAGLESVLAAQGIRFCFVDRHLVAGGRPLSVYAEHDDPTRHAGARSTDWPVTGIEPFGAFRIAASDVACFAREAGTAERVWSREAGYPGDPAYLEFHKRDARAGLRYWAVTDARADLGAKALYRHRRAMARVPAHAAHFLDTVAAAGARARGHGVPAQLCAMYDTELFGHWWFEGTRFLAAALDRAGAHGVELATAGASLRRHGTRGSLDLPEGSWGAGGLHQVWLQPDTLAGWRLVHEAERRLERAADRALERDRDAILDRLLAQAGREVMLLEASDWPFLITTGAARDYAEARLEGHAADASRLLASAEARLTGAPLAAEDRAFLEACERRDGLFPEFDWRLAADPARLTGARVGSGWPDP